MSRPTPFFVESYNGGRLEFNGELSDDSRIRFVNPYPTRWMHWLDWLSIRLMAPCRYTMDECVACWISTTEERKRPHTRLPYYLLVFPITLVLFVLFLPLCCVGLCLWFPIRQKRKPYRYAYNAALSSGVENSTRSHFTVATTNACLLHETVSRMNNLADVYGRGKRIGATIAQQQVELAQGPLISPKDNVTPYEYNSNKRIDHQAAANGTSVPFVYNVLTEFPSLDFLLLQETFNKQSAPGLVRELLEAFPYVIFDVGIDSIATNGYCYNSGLMLASKFPILDISFRCFSQTIFACRYASKGILQLKVGLGRSASGQRLVGYVSTTHLQSYQGTDPVHTSQLQELCKWTREFRQSSLRKGEEIAFDVLGGDFNVDNMSPVDERDFSLPLFTEDYIDVCRQMPGHDFPWTVGTEMRRIPLHDALISTPEGLKEALDDPYLLQYYVLDGDVTDASMELDMLMPKRDDRGHPILSPVGGRRRIDYIMYHRQYPVVVTGCHAVTQLAGLSDHIPYALTFHISR